MSEVAFFVDSFDHTGPAWAPSKYFHARIPPGPPDEAGDFTPLTGPPYTEVPGPYHGVAARFPGRGYEVGPADFWRQLTGVAPWTSGAFSCSLKVDAEGWTGPGHLGLLAPVLFTGTIPWVGADSFEYIHNWLTVDSTGTLRLWVWNLPPWGPDLPVLPVEALTSAPGALPLGEWVTLEYRTRLRRENIVRPPPNPAGGDGSIGVRVNGLEVLASDEIYTASFFIPDRRADHIRFGHLQRQPEEPRGVLGLGVGGEGVGVAFDDVCQRADTVVDAPLLPYRDLPTTPHRVVALRPRGPGSAAELAPTGAFANWQACAESPPDGEVSFVEREPLPVDWDGDELPKDLYLMEAAPEFSEGAAGATFIVWGLCRSDDAPTVSVPNPRAVLHRRDGLGNRAGRLNLVRDTYHYGLLDCVIGGSRALHLLTNAHMVGFEAGWGGDPGVVTTLGETFRGSQTVVELWYSPGTAPACPPVTGGGGGPRWSATWVG